MTDTTQKEATAGIKLTDDITAAVNGAAETGKPLVVAYVDTTGEPHLSLRGTVHVFEKDRLALWSRSPGLPEAIKANPRVALLYQNLAQRTLYRFGGLAHVEEGESVRTQVFENSPEREQAQDPNRHGSAIIIKLESVDGMTSGGPVRLTRRPSGT
jgi:hypothetical protein